MQGLLLRLSALDAVAESAVRLISFFDSLVEQHVDLKTLLRHAAMIAECDVGFEDPVPRSCVRATPAGVVDDGAPDPGARVRRLASGQVAWLARGPENAHPCDEMLLERLAIACSATLERQSPTLPALGDPALLELVIGRTTAAPERTRALQLLGLPPGGDITLLAVQGPDAPATVATALGGTYSRWARLGEVHVIALAGSLTVDPAPPEGVTVGVGPTLGASEAPTIWERAVLALRYTTTRSRVVHAARLGPYELLAAQLRSADIGGFHDLDVLDELAARPGGAEVLHTVEVVAEVGSLREAARRLHLHHNSVSTRVARAEERLGYRVTGMPGLARICLTLALRRLRDRDIAT